MTTRSARGAALGLALSLVGAEARAQSLIVGIPSAETTERGRFGLAHESQALVFQGPPAWNSFSFLTYGVSEHVEASVALLGLAWPAYGDRVLGAGFKWVLPLFERQARAWELRLGFGATALFSLDRGTSGGWAYALASARIPWTHTRLTAGVSFATELLYGPDRAPASAMVGVEQPLTPWLSLVADWYSGDHALAAFIFGPQFTVNRYLTVIAGAKLDNDRAQPRDGLLLELMLTL